MTIKNKKWMRAGNSMHKTVDRQTARVTKWQTTNQRLQKSGQTRTRWRNEIGVYARVGWSALTSDKERGTSGKAFVMQWTW